LATWDQRSKDVNFVAVHVQKVVINGEEANEGEEIEDSLHSLSTSWAEILAIWAQRSEDANIVAVHVQQVVVNGETANEGKKIEDGLHSLSTS
jgi:hypothetical protein